MDLQPIIHQGRTVAAATRERFFLADDLDCRPPGDADVVFVVYLCLYARDVLLGELPGPYTDEDAHRYARACLIPRELLDRDGLPIEHTAAGLGVPARELAAALAEHRASHGARQLFRPAAIARQQQRRAGA